MKLWVEELKVKIKKKRQILFSKDSACLSSLQMKLQEASHEQVIAWAMIALAQPLNYLVKHYPNDTRPMEAVALTTKWHQKQIKMTPAKQAILLFMGWQNHLMTPLLVPIAMLLDMLVPQLMLRPMRLGCLCMN